MKLLNKLFFTLFISSSIFASAQNMDAYLADPNSGPREHSLDMERMRLEISFEPQKGLVKGKVTHFFKPIQQKVDTIFFDAPKINIKEARLNNQPVRFTISETGVTVFPAKPLTWDTNDSITFIYEATPRKGIYFIGWNDEKNLSRKQIWTQGQGTDNRYWIPSYDEMNDKLITEVIVTFDKDYSVLSNGTKLSEKDNKNGTKTWHYKMTHPHAPYLLMLGIGKYDIKKTKSKSGVPMNLWYYPDMADRVESTYIYSEKMVDFMESKDGIGYPYPWESYSQIPVQDFMYGAMENTTATLFGDFFIVDKRAFLSRNYIAVNAHELAHQWFGDLVTARSGKHGWLQETFATHYDKHFLKSIYGEDVYQWEKRMEANAAINAGKENSMPVVHTQGGGARVYQKGSFVLDMIRYVVGDEGYKRTIQYYLKKHAYQNVETNDLLQAFQDVLGLNLNWFFNEWLYRGGEPNYEVTYDDMMLNDGNQYTQFVVKQTHVVNNLVGYFKMPIVFQVFYKDGTSSEVKEWIEKQEQVVRVPNPAHKKIDFVLFDPNSNVLKTVVFKKSFEELTAQALHAPNMLDRYDAIVAMRDTSVVKFEQKINVLAEIFKKESFHFLKTEIIAQLAENDYPESITILNLALQDADAKVRLSAVQNIQRIYPLLLANFEKCLQDSSYDVVETALVKLCNQYPERTADYLERTKNDYGIGNSVKVKWLEMGCRMDMQKYLPTLVAYSSHSYEFRTRMNAFNALQRLNYLDNDVLNNLFDAALNPNTRLASAATTVLDYFYKQNNFKPLIQQYYESKQWNDWQKELLEKYGK